MCVDHSPNIFADDEVYLAGILSNTVLAIPSFARNAYTREFMRARQLTRYFTLYPSIWPGYENNPEPLKFEFSKDIIINGDIKNENELRSFGSIMKFDS